ncbi:MAG: hypothetical protein JWR32_685 [Mycobacterium sp.]|jgi:hypothetical protein|nr:hypothetical protein [Mycobacterium sp.]
MRLLIPIVATAMHYCGWPGGVDLTAVDWHVKQQNPAAPRSQVQNETLDVTRFMVSDGQAGNVGFQLLAAQT